MAEEKKIPASAPKMTKKQIWQIVGIGADVVVTIFLLVLSIILLANIKTNLTNATGFMGMINYFKTTQNGPTVFLCAVVVPLFILLVLNIIITVTYYQKEAAKEKAEAEKAKAGAASLDNLSDAQKEALRQELLKEMKGEVKPEEAKEEEKK